jgi:ketosteroid isomerase-like protein
MRKNLATLLPILALAACAPEGPTANAQDRESSRAADIETLRQIKLEQWPGYYREQDWQGLQDFLTEDFVLVAPDGSAENREQTVEWVRDNPWGNADANFEYTIRRIDFYSDDVANIHGTGRFDGEDCRMAYESANILVRKNGEWKAAFSQTSAPRCDEA